MIYCSTGQNSRELVGKTAIYKGEIPAIYAGYLVKLLLMNSDYLNFITMRLLLLSNC